MSGNCRECGQKLRDFRHAKRHYRKEHGGEVETPEEYLPDTESEQRDFDGEEPDEDGHEPEYETTNDPPETKYVNLHRWSEDEE